MTTKDWIIKTKTENPELINFIIKLERFISDSGLNTTKFEKAVEASLINIELEVAKTLKPDKIAENK